MSAAATPEDYAQSEALCDSWFDRGSVDTESLAVAIAEAREAGRAEQRESDAKMAEEKAAKHAEAHAAGGDDSPGNRIAELTAQGIAAAIRTNRGPLAERRGGAAPSEPAPPQEHSRCLPVGCVCFACDGLATSSFGSCEEHVKDAFRLGVEIEGARRRSPAGGESELPEGGNRDA